VSALRIAEWLEGQDAVEAVFYPGLESNVGHEIAARQMRGFGGMLSFSLVGGFDAVRRFLPRLRLAHRAANLGAVETIAGIPATTSHVECTAEERAAMGIPEALIRLSVGIEHPDDLIADLQQAMA
jgi:cystathionine gamma-synthase